MFAVNGVAPRSSTTVTDHVGASVLQFEVQRAIRSGLDVEPRSSHARTSSLVAPYFPDSQPKPPPRAKPAPTSQTFTLGWG